jgi:uncharacterized protein (UPF0276 family)
MKPSDEGPEPLRAGVGLRLPHFAEAAAGAACGGWMEVHPENVLANPHARELLLAVRTHGAVGLHTVGLSVGSADGIDREYLARLRCLVDDLDPFIVSGHLAWSTHHGVYLSDLLPLPYDDETLNIVAAHVAKVQEALGRRYVIENPARYVSFVASTLAEAEFLAELAARTGCGLLCDVSNVFLSAANMGYDAYAYIDALPASAIAEIHLGGFTAEADDGGREVLVDTHAGPIAPPVWDLYAHALRRFGARPTLIEWDNAIPALPVLVAEAAHADEVAHATLPKGEPHAAAR